MSAEVYGLLHIGRNEGIGAAGDGECAVGDTAAIGEVCKLINRSPTLETKVLEEFEVGGLAEDGGGELT